MFRKFSEWAVAYAIRLGYIPKEEQEEYTYGLDLVMSVIVSDLTMLIIGIIMKMIPQVIVFGFMYKFIINHKVIFDYLFKSSYMPV